jgi:hypothetical protein
MRTALFWVITQRVVVICYRRFGKTFPETPVRNYHYWLLSRPEERRSLLHRDGSPKSRTAILTFVCIACYLWGMLISALVRLFCTAAKRFTGDCVVKYCYPLHDHFPWCNKQNIYQCYYINKPTWCNFMQSHLFFIAIHSICFGRLLHPSSGVQLNCSYSDRYISSCKI